MQEFAAAAPAPPAAEEPDGAPPPAPPLVVQPLVLNQEAIDAWEQREINARALILFNVDEDQQASIRACKTAMEMWDQLHNEYALMASDNAMISLKNFFHYKYNPSMSKKSKPHCVQNLN
jgi:hypothetical protein